MAGHFRLLDSQALNIGFDIQYRKPFQLLAYGKAPQANNILVNNLFFRPARSPDWNPAETQIME
jgi:hypothetical protein